MRQIDVRLIDGRVTDAESTGGAVLGLRVAIGAGLLALGWLVLGSAAGGASATELDIGDGSLLGPDSSLALVTEPIALPDVVTDAAAVPELTEPVSQRVEPVLESVEPVLEPVVPVLEPVLDAIAPVLQSVEPVLKNVESTVFGTLPESILAAPEQAPAPHCVTACDVGAAELPAFVPGDIRSTNDLSAVALEDPVRHAPAPSAPLAPTVLSETVAPGASGSIALASDVAERGWVSSAPSAHTMPPGDDIPPASPTYDSDSTPD